MILVSFASLASLVIIVSILSLSPPSAAYSDTMMERWSIKMNL